MNAPLLFDTCALIWLSGLPADQNAGAIEESLDQARSRGQDIFLSPMSAWEIGLLVAKGRLTLALPVRAWIDRLLHATGIRWAELSVGVLLSSNALPGELHADPADRIIIATAREYGMRLVTRDRRILDYAEKGHVMALAC